MTRFALACCCAFAVGSGPAAAQTAPASTPAPIVAPSPDAVKVAAALSRVTSFRMLLSSTYGMGGAVTVLVPQKRSKALIAMGTMTSEVVMAEGRMYARVNGADWHVTDPPQTGAPGDATFKSMLDPTKIHILPDRVENGTTVGAYEITMASMPGAPANSPPATCTYDKTTYLPRTCSAQTMTSTFEGWNDPANVVAVPVVASPAPAASPHP